VYGNGELNMRFQKEFNHLWTNSRDFLHTQTFEYFESDTIEEADIPADATIDAVFTSANFRTYVSSSNGPTFSVIRGENEIADRIVEHIEAAQSSIHIASGHLRSRPVTEALIAKYEANPSLDVKVYLDGQEYVSSYTNRLELQKREACLEAAGTSIAKQQDCLDKGFHYAYPVYEAGIDLRFKYYSYRWHYSYAPQMHHKYIIIDGKTVISGSYNLSDNAEHNTMENMVIYEEAGFPEVVAAYNENFASIWNTGDGLLDDLMGEIEGSSRVPIVFDAMSLTYSQVNTLKRAISSACPEVNSNDYRRNPERHFVCYRD
jgi:phosphatidylserine/phosphatidylglycerophosphate/cardiolipin synthase-like enzyme